MGTATVKLAAHFGVARLILVGRSHERLADVRSLAGPIPTEVVALEALADDWPSAGGLTQAIRALTPDGADAVIVSNHGGRADASGRSSIQSLPEVVRAVDGRIPVLVDGGFRRGTDVLKALALGADAICIGRPYLWGMAAFGQAGVEKVLEILVAELQVAMQLHGAPSLAELDSSFVVAG